MASCQLTCIFSPLLGNWRVFLFDSLPFPEAAYYLGNTGDHVAENGAEFLQMTVKFRVSLKTS